MNCVYHKEREVQGICSTCGRTACAECLVDLSGHNHCKNCLEARMTRPRRDVNGFVRFVLSAAPGLGHLYMGLFNRGIQFMLGTVGGAILLGMIFPALLGFWIPASVFLSIFDAREAHLRLEQGLEVEDKAIVDLRNFTLSPQWNPRYVGYALIGVGALVLYDTVLKDFLYIVIDRSIYSDVVETIQGITMGALAILGGVWMIRRSVGKA